MLQWIKNKIISFLIATSKVEDAALSQESKGDLSDDIGKIQKKNHGSMVNDMVQGKLTEEVKKERWRMYKILEHVNNLSYKVIGYDENDNPITTKKTVDERKQLKSVKLDKFDDYKLELVVTNKKTTIGINDSIDGVEKQVTSISCNRDLLTKFNIEDYTKKLNVRGITKSEKLLEFYISKYPNEYDRKSRFFLSEVKRGIKNPRHVDFLNIDSIIFISDNVLGAMDLMLFEYGIKSFDKIIEFDGHYVIKFKADIIKNGESIVEELRDKGLDKRYNNKENKN